jgi:hypothetical protein
MIQAHKSTEQQYSLVVGADGRPNRVQMRLKRIELEIPKGDGDLISLVQSPPLVRICIYIYICMCVCMCVSLVLATGTLPPSTKRCPMTPYWLQCLICGRAKQKPTKLTQSLELKHTAASRLAYCLQFIAHIR